MAPAPDKTSLIGGEYAISFGGPLLEVGGGLRTLPASNRQGQTNFVAIETQHWRPPRAEVLSTLTGGSVEGVLAPLAHGVAASPTGSEAYYVIVPAPPGPSLAADLRPWTEREVLDQVLRPAVQALDDLHRRGITHREIRPGNLFRAGPGRPVVLGEAWAAPAASRQPAIFEPPYSAMCLKEGRGDGSAADDVYALGVTMLVLMLGRLPLAGEIDAVVVRRKLELGSYTALAGDARLSGMIADLIRGMLAEDPDHRPPIALLADPAMACARRVAARPPRRAPRSLDLGTRSVWDARLLAYAIATDPATGVEALRDGRIEHWLRRGLADPALGSRIGERVEAAGLSRGGGLNDNASLLLVQAVAILDPLAPICWPQAPIWPDAVGTALAAAQNGTPGQSETLFRLVEAEAARVWATERPERCKVDAVRTEVRQQNAMLRTQTGGRIPLLYSLNPLLPCGSPLLTGRCVPGVAQLLPALEMAVGAPGGRSEDLPIDAHVAAFASVRGNEVVDRRVLDGGASAPLAQLRLLAHLQARYHPSVLPGLGKCLASHEPVLLAGWRNKARLAELRAKLQSYAEAGDLQAMLALVDNESARAEDEAGAARAAAILKAADAEFRHLANAGAERSDQARHIGQEIAAGTALAALATALMMAAVGG